MLLHGDIVLAGQRIDHVKTKVVTRIPVTPPRIPQPNNYIHTRAINSLESNRYYQNNSSVALAQQPRHSLEPVPTIA
jgi:hypothetical protein